MNFLAHAYLAGDSADDRVGGMMGDFVKGHLPGALPEALAAGVRLHRRIDVFADAHPAFRRSRARISAARRRYAGVIVDMYYDHFLAAHWAQFHPQPLEQFAAETYALLAERAPLLPPRLVAILPRMRGDDWLSAYRSADAVALALDRMASRLRRDNPLGGAGDELYRDRAGFEADFFDFIAAASAFAARHRAERDRFSAAE